MNSLNNNHLPNTNRSEQSSQNLGSNQQSSFPKEEDKTSKVAKTFKTCGQCAKQNKEAKVCSQCKLVYYCNTECQALAWKTHKLICKPPQKELFTMTSYNSMGQPQKKEEVSIRTWDKIQTEQQGAKKTDLGSTKQGQKAYESLLSQSNDSSFFALSHKQNKDVVAFCSAFCQEQITDLKLQGYKGLNSLSKDKLKSLIDDQDYAELLKYIWTENDLARLVDWLKPLAEAGHAILMLELVRALAQTAKKTKEPKQELCEEAIKWFTWGMHCAELDSACTDDSSTKSAIGMLSFVYKPLLSCFPKDHWEKLRTNARQVFNEHIKKWTPLQNHPSPKWILFHGLGMYSGKIMLKPKEKWLNIRSQEHQALIEKNNQQL